ncbi:hypothetical protein [Methylobacterium sp. SD21]|uniref:hypothetical protein n=1 Tax=Methylobacterium litchii TaxID=3138810 RepID=UPI00313A9D8A
MARPERTLADGRTVAAFKKWLIKAGAEILPTKGEYEVLRFRGGGVLSVAHCSPKARVWFQGGAEEAFEAYLDGTPCQFTRAEELPPVLDSIGPDSGRIIFDMATEGPVTIAAIMDRLRVTMGAASAFLSTETANGHLTRSGGGRGDAYRWEITRSAA